MPWKETCAMEERFQFVLAYEVGDHAMSELCRQYEISRKTGYKWLERYRNDGISGLEDRSKAPHRCPHAIDEVVASEILKLRRIHPTWGPKKLRARLARLHRTRDWPAASTIGDLLAREGLVHRRRRRHRVPGLSEPFAACKAANDVWCMDFKGWFVTGDGARCEPFTLADAASRYLLRLQAVRSKDSHSIWPLLEAAFREFGLPGAIRSDNGPPFASVAAGRLSPLAVCLIKAGVLPDHIDPASPEQNGRLERLHRTLKEDTAMPPARSRAAQSRRFRAFQRVYNEDRPHEALNMDVPADHYQPSPRSYRGRLKSPEYEAGIEIRKVRRTGEIKWRGSTVYISQTLAGEPVGIEETDDGCWSVHFGPVHLGWLDAQSAFCKPPPRRRGDGLQKREQNEKTVTHVAG